MYTERQCKKKKPGDRIDKKSAIELALILNGVQ